MIEDNHSATDKVALSDFLHYEQWRFPVIAPGGMSDITVSVQLTIHPNQRSRK